MKQVDDFGVIFTCCQMMCGGWISLAVKSRASDLPDDHLVLLASFFGLYHRRCQIFSDTGNIFTHPSLKWLILLALTHWNQAT